MSAALARARAALRRLSADGRWQQHAPLVLVLAPALWVVQPLLRQTPLSYDHASHLFKSWHFWTEMLGRGRLRGWSHFWAFGFPSGELVPFGEELWVAIFRAATLGQLPWTRTYALAFGAFLLLKALTAYVFTRRYFGTGAAVVCSWISLFDPGAMLEGGWDWHTYWGVWPVQLSMCFVLLAYTRLEDVLELGRKRAVFWAGAWLGASLLIHPLALLVLLITAPLFFLEHLLRPGPDLAPVPGSGDRSPALGPPIRLALGVGALAFGVALAAFSFVPFVARSGHAQDLGWLGDPLPVVSQHLLELRTFENVWFPIHGLALLGAWFAVRARHPGGVFLACSAAVCVFLSSDTLIADLHLERALSTLLKIENDRMLLAAKLFWFPLAGHGLVELFRLPVALGPAPTHGRRALRWALALGLGAALLLPGGQSFYETQIKKEFNGERKTEFWDDFQVFLRWSQQLERAPGEFYRIAYHMWRGNHLSTLSPVFNQTPMYKVGYTPTQIFDKFPMTDEHELFEALSVKYVLSSYPLERADLTLERRFGKLWLYRFNSYKPQPFSVIGAGQAELLEFEPERIRIRLSGTAPDTTLKIHVSSYDRWQATLAGTPLPISTVPVYGVEYPVLMQVPVRDGELVIEYVYRSAEWLGLIITLAAGPAFLGLVWLGRRSSVLTRGIALLQRQQRPIGGAALVLLLICSIVIAARTRDRSRMLPPSSIFHQLEGPELSVGDEGCVKTSPLTFKCGSHVIRPEVVSGSWGIHSCMTTRDAEQVQIRATLPLGAFLAGRYDPAPEGPGAIQLDVNGRTLANVATRPAYLRRQSIQFDTTEHAGQRTVVELTISGAALHCFDFRIVS